jgi:DNA-binding MarR family transcriptional regulator
MLKMKEDKPQSKKIRITDRDLEILNFINNFGFCELPQIGKRFNLKIRRAYQIVNRFIEAGLLEHERIFYKKHGIYRLTQKGAKYTELPPLYRVSLANYKHDILMIEVYLKLRALYPEAEWISERQLKHDKYFDGLGKKGHLPDGILKFPNEIIRGEAKQVAIEVELTAKGKKRTESILTGYGKDFSITEVWYYCANNTVEFIRSNAARMQFVKVHTLGELLGNTEWQNKKIF